MQKRTTDSFNLLLSKHDRDDLEARRQVSTVAFQGLGIQKNNNFDSYDKLSGYNLKINL
ncbi:hypothetical protein DSUL_20549 [Desulfovibrionales bacterium]